MLNLKINGKFFKCLHLPSRLVVFSVTAQERNDGVPSFRLWQCWMQERIDESLAAVERERQINKQLMQRKQETEWQLMEALSQVGRTPTLKPSAKSWPNYCHCFLFFCGMTPFINLLS